MPAAGAAERHGRIAAGLRAQLGQPGVEETFDLRHVGDDVGIAVEVLADFGIALRRGGNPRLTSAGLAVGSTAYMPPEQARGLEVDRRADLYSLGVLGWEMLTGRLPYCASDALTMALKHVQDPIPRLPGVLRHWQPLFDAALAKRPEDRPASAQDMRD